jgi:hypothetical protein
MEEDDEMDKLKSIMSNRKWQEKIEHRTEAFYQIISKLVT